MSEWWQEPYRGGGPAKVLGFPRPLYPPDVPPASGYEPSSRGPDVIAYKRTLCKLSRWGPWDPDAWDDGYWTDFAHGRDDGDSVEQRLWSGVSGFQWQQHLDATGWLGEKTFNALRYALVPQGPHKGEQAMDSVAVDLINEAWTMFEGHPSPPAGSKGTVRAAALELAIGELGYKESPAGSNLNKFGKWYGMDGAPWCAMFCTWAYEVASDGRSPGFAKGSRYAYVPYIVSDARGNRGGLRTVGEPEPGDLVCYDWDWNGEHDHVGLFEKWIGPREFNAIEGNTSTSSNSNGGQVMRRARATGAQATIFVRVEEP